jgi:proline dehydrogenase
MSDAALFDTAPPEPAPRAMAALKARVLRAASAKLIPALRRIAPGHVGGETLADACLVARAVTAEGHGVTLGYWDSGAETPEAVLEAYLNALPWVAADGGYLSIKPPALRFHPAAAARLAEAALAAGVRLHCDSHGLEAAMPTFGFVDELLRALPPHLVSVTIPGRWARSPADAAWVLDRGVGIRIVKGQWPDAQDVDLREGFLEVVRSAAAGGPGHVAIATHDLPLAQSALARLGAGAELEMIHGLQTRALHGLADQTGQPARLYIPYGPGFAPSALRILKQNPRLAISMLRALARR